VFAAGAAATSKVQAAEECSLSDDSVSLASIDLSTPAETDSPLSSTPPTATTLTISPIQTAQVKLATHAQARILQLEREGSADGVLAILLMDPTRSSIQEAAAKNNVMQQRRNDGGAAAELTRLLQVNGVVALVKQGVSVNDLSTRYTPLVCACANGAIDAVRLLLDHTAIAVDQPDVDGWTPLMYRLSLSCARLAIEHRRLVSHPRHAAARGKEEVVVELLRAGAQRHRATANGDTALQLAATRGQTYVKWILQTDPSTATLQQVHRPLRLLLLSVMCWDRPLSRTTSSLSRL
jgi:hypothetical protein